MTKGKLNGHHHRKNPEIQQLGRWKSHRSCKEAGNKMIANGMERDAALAQLEAVRQNPGSFLADALLADLARECILRKNQKDEPSEDTLRESHLPFPIWGTDNQIDPEAIKQMENAMRLPVTVTGALMPDAHVGYGLPIGGVLATENVVIPYAVGVDIACRMRFRSTKSLRPHRTEERHVRKSLWEETAFGMGAKWTGSKRAQHASVR
jgi:tRNA-splicing ligase RtcB